MKITEGGFSYPPAGENAAKLRQLPQGNSGLFDPIIAGQIDPRYFELHLNLAAFDPDPEKGNSFKGGARIKTTPFHLSHFRTSQLA